MKICIVGLGLIGGSLAKAAKKYTEHRIIGIDTDKDVAALAISQGAVDEIADSPEAADLTFVCLYPEQTIRFINSAVFKKNSTVADVCGVKRYIIDHTEDNLAKRGVRFVGTHPMAGREFSGFEYSSETLWRGASFIIAETENSDIRSVNLLSDFATSIGFERVVKTTPEDHDRVIAYTSQLAHIVSSAYIKSPSQSEQAGFSAGSYKDLTRVAKLNADMWTPLFLSNKNALTYEIGEIIAHLEEYKKAIKNGETDKLHQLLVDGTILKERDEN
ncbi:MAG: prephenate dehydrogenase [Ruminococcus sp.]|jgi:prephenate dehydrogenase|nr:prephenate dehydrogenase [Ruminococcus sp.]